MYVGSGVGVGSLKMVETEEQPVRTRAAAMSRLAKANVNSLVFISGLLV